MPCSLDYTLYTIHYTLYTIHCTLYTIHYKLYTIHYTLYTIHYTLYTDISQKSTTCIIAISDFHSKMAENCALLGYNAASSGNFLPTFRDNLLFPSSGFKNPTLCMGRVSCPETWVRNYHYSPRNNPEERSSLLA